MIQIIAVTTALLLLTAGSGLGAPSFLNKDDYPKVDGSTSTQFLQSLVKSKILGTDEVVPHSDTEKSFSYLINGRVDLILTARAPTKEEHDLARDKRMILDARPIALDALVFLVNKDNPTNDLTVDQIKDIFSGKRTRWGIWKSEGTSSREIPAGDRTRPSDRRDRILSYQRDRFSGSEELMRSLVMKNTPVNFTSEYTMVHPETIMSMYRTVIRVAEQRNSISYSIFYYMKHLDRLIDVKRKALDAQRKRHKKHLLMLNESDLKKKDPEYWDQLRNREAERFKTSEKKQEATINGTESALSDTPHVKMIAVNGVEPTKQTIASKNILSVRKYMSSL